MLMIVARGAIVYALNNNSPTVGVIAILSVVGILIVNQVFASQPSLKPVEF